MLSVQLGTGVTTLVVSEAVKLNAEQVSFCFWKKDEGGFAFNTAYTVLTSANLGSFNADQFSGNSIDGVEPTFTIIGNELQVTYWQQ